MKRQNRIARQNQMTPWSRITRQNQMVHPDGMIPWNNKEFRFAKLCAANASHQRHDKLSLEVTVSSKNLLSTTIPTLQYAIIFLFNKKIWSYPLHQYNKVVVAERLDPE